MRRRQQRRQAGLTAPAAHPPDPASETEPGPESESDIIVTMDEVQAAAIGDEPEPPAPEPYQPLPAHYSTAQENAVEAEQMEDEITTTDPFTTVYPYEDGPTDALVIRCADPRFRDACIRFEEDIGITNPAVLAVTGSIKSFGLQLVIPKEWHGLKKQLELLTSRHSHIPRVVLFTHEDCKSYADSAAKGLLKRFTSVLGAQRGHLVELAKYVKKQYLPNAKFELYHAAIVADDKGKGVKFERVAEF